MPRKSTIYLTYQNETLWWSADEENWGKVGPNSPYTTLTKAAEITWEGDESIEEIEIQLNNNEIMDPPANQGRKKKKGKVKNGASKGAHTKYSIAVTPKGSTSAITIDPDMKMCGDQPCPPGV